MLRRSVSVGDEPLSRSDEIVKDILFIQLDAGFMPFFSIFAAPANICGGKEEALLKERQDERAVNGRGGDVEAAITIEKSGILAVQLQSLLVAKEHGDTSAVLARIKDRLRLVVIGVEPRNLWRVVDPGRVRGDVVAENGGWIVGRSEGIKDKGIFGIALEIRGGARARQMNFIFLLSIEVQNVYVAGDIFQVSDENLAA